MARVLLDNVTKRFGNVIAVNEANLDILDKEFVVLVGPSGCGKSTTLRMVAGLEEITDGKIYIGDVVVNDIPPKDRDIAMVFQNYALYPHMDVYNNMAFGLKLRRFPRAEIDQRVKEAARMLGIENLLDRKPKALSGGQRQRVAVGRAIVREPKVFLMDEPLSNLDAKLRVQMRAELSKLHNRLQTTMIYVTHDQTEAMTMATKIVLLDDGKVQQAGRPSEFYEKPANLFVAGFIGSPTMNTFPGVIEKGLFKADGDLFTVEPGQEDKKKLSGHEGKRVVMGIRSERFLAGKAEKNGITVEVDVIEMLGKEQLLYCKFPNGKECVISEPGHFKYAIDEEHNFHLDTQGLHFFDEETSGRIN